MVEAVFPPSPSWFLPNIISSRDDGSVCYGSKTNIVILKASQNLESTETWFIQNAHTLRISSVAFSPRNSDESIQNTIASCSEDGLVKLWRINSLSAVMAHMTHWEEKEEMGKIICLDWSLANPHQIISVAENSSIVSWDVLANTTAKFSFRKLKATVIACCPFNQKIVAVGAKTGEVYVINLTDSGSTLFTLRGHDNTINSLAWCPLPYNVFDKSKCHQEFLLASACQDKDVYVWRAGSDGKCEIKFQIPTCSISKSHIYKKLGNSFSYIALYWADPYRIFCSSNFGELIYFDVMSYVISELLDSGVMGQKLPKQLFGFFKLAHRFHSKGLFAIAPISSPLEGNVSLFGIPEERLDSKLEIQSKWKIVNELKNEEDILKWKAVAVDQPRLLWTSGQDRKLVACDSTELNMVFNYNTVNGGLYCAVVSPHDPNKIAIGVGDGMIRLWNLSDPNGVIDTYWQKIKDRVMSLAWHPSRDGLLAYGTSKGRVGLIDTNSNKPPKVFKPGSPQPIYNLSWGPELPYSPQEGTGEFNLFFVGDNMLSFYSPSKQSTDPVNLSKMIPFPYKKQTDVCWKPDYSLMAVGNEDGSICLVDPSQFKIVHTVQAYKKLIESIAWHPLSTSLDSDVSPYQGYFTSGSTDNDNEIRVFNCQKNEGRVEVNQVATLKGHYGHIQSVSWSPHVGGQLVSCSMDCSVQIWDVVSQYPLVNFTPSGMPMFSLWSPVDSDVILTGCRHDVLCLWRVSKQTKICPTPKTKTKLRKKEIKHFLQHVNGTSGQKKESDQRTDDVAVNGTENGILAEVAVPEDKTSSNNSKELKRFSKAWKKDDNDLLQSCYSKLKEEKMKENIENYSLPFLCDEDCLAEFIKTEGESYQRAHNWNEYYELSLWKGDLEKVLRNKIQSGQLNDFLVSLAPSVSTRLWTDACLTYSKTLEEKKLYRKAASYLIACRKIYEAIDMLSNASLYLEALCIARSFLPVEDPIIKRVVNEYANWLFKNGSFLKACECYIYTGCYLEVAKICGKKSQPEYLSLAALAARKCGSPDLESLEATNALLKCFESNDLVLAKRICDDHCNLKHLTVMYNMYRTIYELDEGELFLEKDILTFVREMMQTADVDFPNTSTKFYNKYTFYKFKRQMLIVVAQELSFACCEKDLQNVVTHLVKALNTCCRYIQTSENDVHPLFKLCTWLSPKGFLSSNSYFTLTETDLLPKVKSLRGFLCSAIARNLNCGPSADDVGKYLNLLKEVLDDLLDIDSYKYFKNLIDVEISEKRLLTNRNKIAKDKLMDGKDKLNRENGDVCSLPPATSKDIEDVNRTSEDSEKIRNDVENLEQSLKKVSEAESLSEETGDSDVVVENHESSQILGDSLLEEKILRDTVLLNNLKAEIECFENIRISSPNPVPYYSMLKYFLEGISENDSAKSLLESLEEKWMQLNQ